ncbi:MAG: transposase [Capsulimonadaceae bacterium]|nr:transposase [Capsulimonadaceae bacterium]
MIAFSDETGVELTPNACRTWAPVGQTPVLRHTYKREKSSVIGAITWDPVADDCDCLIHIHDHGVIASDQVIVFLNGLHEMTDRPVVLIWDNITTHHSKIVKEYIAANSDWLTVVNLPSYSPDLNPIEFLWSVWKRTYLANVCKNKIEQVTDILIENQAALSDQDLLKGCIIGAGLTDRTESEI